MKTEEYKRTISHLSDINIKISDLDRKRRAENIQIEEALNNDLQQTLVDDISHVYKKKRNLILELNQNFIERGGDITDYVEILNRDIDNEIKLAQDNRELFNLGESKWQHNSDDTSLLIATSSYQAHSSEPTKFSIEQVLDYFECTLISLKRTIEATLTGLNPKKYPNTKISESKAFDKAFRIDINKSFDDLFYNPDIRDQCYNILLEAGLIDKEFYFLKDKGAFCIWVKKIEAARSGGKPIIDRQKNAEYTRLLNLKFTGLDMHHSNFGTSMARLKENYERDIDLQLSQLSLKK